MIGYTHRERKSANELRTLTADDTITEGANWVAGTAEVDGITVEQLIEISNWNLVASDGVDIACRR